MDLEQPIADLLDRKRRAVLGGEYRPQDPAQIDGPLARLFAADGRHVEILAARRLSGGGSKEQFVFENRENGVCAKQVLRLDPIQSTVETDRRRECEILRAMRNVVPVPEIEALDADGTFFGRPALVMSFMPGVMQPTERRSGNVSGMGMSFPPALRTALAEEFLVHLAAIHLMDWEAADLPSFRAPDSDAFQAARWQVNWWSRVWQDDHLAPSPSQFVIEQWLRDNLPPCTHPVVVHGDYRPGNFLFDEKTRRITAILDWELAHIGDYHEELAFMLQTGLSTTEDGQELVCGLMPRATLLARYSELTGLPICDRTLHFYEILVRYKLFVLMISTSARAAHCGQFHQDTHVSWLAAAGHFYHAQLCEMILGSEGL